MAEYDVRKGIFFYGNHLNFMDYINFLGNIREQKSLKSLEQESGVGTSWNLCH